METAHKTNTVFTNSKQTSSDEEENNSIVLMQTGADDEEDQLGSDESDEGKEEDEQGSNDDDDDDEEEDDHAGGDGSEEGSDGDEDEAEEEEEGESAVWTREDIKKELSVMPFEDILELQNRVGTKAYKQVAYGAAGQPQSAAGRKRLNKNRPAEVSAKKPAPFLRQVVAVKKATLRDPRFDDLSGEYKADIFDKTYKFIHNIRERETQELQKQLKKTKNSDRKEKLSFLLKKMANQERARQSQEQQRARELQYKQEQRERANRGARPFFLKKCEQKKLRLAARFSDLKKSGKLDAFLSKKRKRNAGKDRRKLPRQQQRGNHATQ
ncbi:ribosomal RNA processing protein 36 homolog isoform X1 [Phyllopteryx taeniolatus]|uniref:ribosomal RNA processing protein 36 homolog isoform X1 n=1 Tax=Phyllopteryx taeniolatus TaxID=161469 RepID=UPI002AD5B027|nr:ribosomal RNA processing protein 36 homolog isoform X1 [Phyllopteryx taeniolatus]XP_061627061.1 ribosomal RNA processing protein 36 homolog isoform X1 [Phyllopteryx taeniolatus]